MEFKREIFEVSKPKFLAKFEKLVRRAKKLKLEAPTALFSAPFMKKVESQVDDWNPEGLVSHIEVTVSGEVPRVNGYKLVAVCDHFSSENILNLVPGNEDLDLSAYHTRRICDHCQTHRRRNKSYILQHETGKLIQLGSNCSADFFRSAEMEANLHFYESLSEFMSDEDFEEEDGDYFGTSIRAASAENFVGLLLFVVENHGFISGRQAYEKIGVLSTRQRIDHLFFDNKDYKRDEPHPDSSFWARQDVHEKTQEIIQFARNLKDSNEFQRTLRIVFSEDIIPVKYFGVAAAVYLLWQKAIKVATEAVNKTHFDLEVGKRYKNKAGLKTTVLSCPSIETMYGNLQILTLLTERNEVLVWKSTSAPVLSKGEEFVLEAFTVKEHTDYKGMPQTVISRPKEK